MRRYKILVDEAEELLTIAGAKRVSRQAEPRWPGGATHELGSCRMGENAPQCRMIGSAAVAG